LRKTLELMMVNRSEGRRVALRMSWRFVGEEACPARAAR
jgi:hypothetical protein